MLKKILWYQRDLNEGQKTVDKKITVSQTAFEGAKRMVIYSRSGYFVSEL